MAGGIVIRVVTGLFLCAALCAQAFLVPHTAVPRRVRQLLARGGGPHSAGRWGHSETTESQQATRARAMQEDTEDQVWDRGQPESYNEGMAYSYLSH